MHLIANDGFNIYLYWCKIFAYIFFLYKGIAKQLLSGSKWFHALVWVAGVFLMLAKCFHTVLCEMYSMSMTLFTFFTI